ncbi:hypothetical protein N8015_03235 [Planktomarina temperata]|nr:hypothetical protein [Planktomarina temperata]
MMKMHSDVKIAYFHYRGFGDMVINAYCRRLFCITSIDFVPCYLIDLFNLVSSQPSNAVILDNILTTPAFINLKRSAPTDIIKSAGQLRRVFQRIQSDFPDHIIFQDYKRWQQDIYFSASTHTPKRLDNVYLSHISMYQKLGLKTRATATQVTKNDGTVRIFPFSSSNHKNINAHVLQFVCDHLNSLGKIYEVVYLENEKVFEFEHNYAIVPKTFDHLMAKLRDSSFNISCDSLPAHLSSFYNIDTLVLIPEKNKYWLPLNSFSNDNYVTLESLGSGQYSNLIELIARNLYENS